MYLNYWGMRARPFENARDPAFYYPSRSHQTALLRLRYALEDRSGNAGLIGPTGIGKTLLLNHLQRIVSVQENLGPFIHLVFPHFKAEEMLQYFAARLCMELREFSDFPSVSASYPTDNPGALSECAESGKTRNSREKDWEILFRSIYPHQPLLLLEMERLLKENVRNGKRAVFVLDEADTIENPQTGRIIKSLLEIEHGGLPCVSLLLLGEEINFHPHSLIAVLQERIEVKCILEPFDEWETNQYISHRLHAVGTREEVFTREATQRIHELTAGIPRKINRLCDLALLVGYAEKTRTIPLESVETLFDELVAI